MSTHEAVICGNHCAGKGVGTVIEAVGAGSIGASMCSRLIT